MNIFYAVSTNSFEAGLTKIVETRIPKYLRSLGDKVYVYRYDPSKARRLVSFNEINQQILDSDVYIGEMSRASQSLGFQLSYAVSLTKPCLYLYHESRSGLPDILLADNPSRLLRIRTYNNDNYTQVLDKFIKSAAKQLPSRRTSFMSTVRIDSHISNIAKANGIAKGEAIRQILDSALSSSLEKNENQ